MARVGFTKTVEDFSVSAEAFADLVVLFRQYALAAGFAEHAWQAPTAGNAYTAAFDFWCDKGVFDVPEDRPRYRLAAEFHLFNLWMAGADWQVQADADAGINFWGGTVTACFDGDQGWWWLVYSEPGEFGGDYAMICSRQSRLMLDTRPGIAPRFGVLNPSGGGLPDFLRRPPCLVAMQGATPVDGLGDGRSLIWSPLAGSGQTPNLQDAGSVAPALKMAAPVFAAGPFDGLPIFAGELLDVMVVTGGYADGEAVCPGWAAFSPTRLQVALRVPAVFDSLNL